MIEQWFLDLDGVRSGPYQTPEVMSLVAEGEVLPHHRISTSLREQRWITILDWRLDQAKISQKAPSPFSKSRSEVSSVEGLNQEPRRAFTPPPEPSHAPELKQYTQAPVKAAPAPQAEAPRTPPQQKAEQRPEQKAEQKPEQKIELELPSDSEIHYQEVEAGMALPKEETAAFSRKDRPAPPPHSEPERPKPKPVPQAAVREMPLNAAEHESNLDGDNELAKPAARRDPMAEMYDMLQNTKQKKQAKQNHEATAGISIEQDIGEPIKKSSFGLGRTLSIGLGITLVGFALGQLFQQSAPPKDPSAAGTSASTSSSGPNSGSASNSNSGTKSSKGASSASASATSGETEVIDRSTDKMTIKGIVPKESQTGAAPTKINSRNAHAGATAGTETPQTEKELEELRNLKKELQELKNLKNNAVDESPDMNDSPTERTEQVMDPTVRPDQGNDPNAPTTTYPAEGGPPYNNQNNGENLNR